MPSRAASPPPQSRVLRPFPETHLFSCRYTKVILVLNTVRAKTICTPSFVHFNFLIV